MSEHVDTTHQAIAQGSQSFAAAAKLMPPGIRDDTVMLYAWCRHADDVIDGQVLGDQPELIDDPQARLEDLRSQTIEALQGATSMMPPFAALREVARRHDFPDHWPLDLIEGFAMDVQDRRYRSLDDVLDYSYHVAGVVGVMMARVMGVRDDAVLDRACDLGLAFQLTNIARDV
ncbi:MAG: phytoene/squalene synthase family protein, partial [Pseudomonadota bacterium]|nr:phytoene/squalene synthase family protein [Pseudomonadota bacterium]